MANIVKVKRSATPAKVPTTSDLALGEIAVNTYDGVMYIKKDNGTASIVQVGGGSGSGDVVGPSSSTDNAVARFDTTTGKLIQNSVVTIDDAGNIVGVNAITFDVTPTATPTTAGAIYWDEGNKSPSVNLDADVTLQLGQEMLALVYNGTGSTITNGSVVAVSGAQGQRPSVVLADADSEALSAPTLGIATEDIANGAEGFVTTFGFVRGINTSAFTAGAPIYLGTTAGQFTATRPPAPAHTVALGWVIKVNASSGEVFVNINNGWELDELHNVLITSPISGNTLIYDASAGVWKNANITAGTGISVTNGAGSITIANTGVTSVSGTAPIASSGGSTPAISISQATTSTNGYLSSTDWNTFNNKTSNTGTVTSVGGTGTVNGLTLTGTVTTSGNLTLGGTLSGTASGLTVGAATTATSAGNLTGGSISGNYTVGNATSPNTYYLQFGDASGWTYRFMTNAAGTPTVRFSFVDNGNFTAVGSVTASNHIGAGTGLTGTAASLSIGGNAATATNAVNLSTDRTNWSTNGTVNAVVGQLAWKNYGNNHTIFDASAGTTPTGAACSNTTPSVAWAGSHPTLMGYNGSNTYGVRVYISNTSEACTGNAATATTATNQSGGTVNATSGSFTALITGATGSVVDINAANDSGSLSCRGNATYPASMSFHRAGVYAINMGLSTSNEFVIGGWSASSNCFRLTGAGAGTFLSTCTATQFNGSGAGLTGTASSLIVGGVSAGVVVGKMIYDTFTATAAQTTFTSSVAYTASKIEVYCNGVKMRNGSDVTVTSGTSVVFATGLAVGSLVDLVYPT